MIDSCESKVFGIGLESMTVGSNEFYLAYGHFHGHLLHRVVEQHHMVGVPADGARHVQRHLVEEQQKRAQLIGYVLGREEVPH